MIITLVQARCFDEVVRRSSFRAAAIALGLSQPSVSTHVANLERAVGARLVDRSTRGVRLTVDGERLVPLIRGLVAADHAFAEECAAVQAGRSARLRIATVRAGIIGGLSQVLALLRERLEVDVEVHQATSPAVVDGVLSGDYDFGIVGYPARDWSGDRMLEAHVVTTEPLGVCARPDHPLMAESPVDPARLAGLPLILLASGSATRQVADTAISTRPGQTVCTVDDADSAAALAAAGLGVAVITPTGQLRHGPELTWRPLTGDHHVSLCVLHRRGGPLLRAAREFLTLVRAGT